MLDSIAHATMTLKQRRPQRRVYGVDVPAKPAIVLLSTYFEGQRGALSRPSKDSTKIVPAIFLRTFRNFPGFLQPDPCPRAVGFATHGRAWNKVCLESTPNRARR